MFVCLCTDGEPTPGNGERRQWEEDRHYCTLEAETHKQFQLYAEVLRDGPSLTLCIHFILVLSPIVSVLYGFIYLFFVSIPSVIL